MRGVIVLCPALLAACGGVVSTVDAGPAAPEDAATAVEDAAPPDAADACAPTCEMDPVTGGLIGWTACDGTYVRYDGGSYACTPQPAAPPYCQVGAIRHPCVGDDWGWWASPDASASGPFVHCADLVDASPAAGEACLYFPTHEQGNCVWQ